MKLPEKLLDISPGWLDQFPDGDDTVGRAADPRSSEERAADPDGNIARLKLAAERATPTAKTAKRKRPAPPQAAE